MKESVAMLSTQEVSWLAYFWQAAFAGPGGDWVRRQVPAGTRQTGGAVTQVQVGLAQRDAEDTLFRSRKYAW